jgi:hypothetical protein
MALKKLRRREPASRELAANDANPDNGTGGRHGGHPCVEAVAVVKGFAALKGRINNYYL